MDHLHNEDGLAHASATEQTDLTALGVRLDQVDDLDAGIEDLLRGGEVVECWGHAVNVAALLGRNLADAVDAFADDVHQAAVDVLRGHGDHAAGGDHFHSAVQTVGGVHGDATHGVLTNVLFAFQNQLLAVFLAHFKCVVNVGQCDVLFEVDVHNCADDLGNSPFYLF